MCLVAGKVFQHLGEGANELEETFFEVIVVLAGRLDEIANDRLALTKLGHIESAQLVQFHDLRHGWEDQARVKSVASRADCLDNLICELLNEDKRANENVCRGNILLECLEILDITKFLKEVAYDLNAHLAALGVDVLYGGRQAALVLRLQYNVNKLNLCASMSLRNNAPGLRIHAGEATAYKNKENRWRIKLEH